MLTYCYLKCIYKYPEYNCWYSSLSINITTQIQKCSNFLFFHICVQSCCVGDLYLWDLFWRKNYLYLYFPGLVGNSQNQSLRSLEKVLHLKYVDNFWYAYFGCHDLLKQTYENTETDFSGYRNGPEQTSTHTETNFNGNQKR